MTLADWIVLLGSAAFLGFFYGWFFFSGGEKKQAGS